MAMPKFDFPKTEAGKRPVMLLTGASRGIGHATVMQFAMAGWRILSCSRQAFSDKCPWPSGADDHVQIDLGDPEDTMRGIAEIKKRLVAEGGKLHALVNNAGISPKGPKGELKFVVNDEVLVKMENNEISVQPRDQSKNARSKWGMSRTQIVNILHGVKDGFEKKLEITGVGYRAALQGKNLQLALGFSHDVVYETPNGITITVPKPTEITVSGIDKQQVGQVAAEIREYRGPEPYKGKGVRYAGERIVRKEGKKK